MYFYFVKLQSRLQFFLHRNERWPLLCRDFSDRNKAVGSDSGNLCPGRPIQDKILKKAASPEVQTSRKIHETAYWMKLLCTGLRTAVGMGVALIMLFSVSQTDFTALHTSPETKAKISSSLDIGFNLSQLSRKVGSQLSENSQNISDNLSDLTNKIINGGK